MALIKNLVPNETICNVLLQKSPFPKDQYKDKRLCLNNN